MPEFEQEYASRIVLDMSQEVMQKRKQSLEQKLAEVGMKLIETHRSLEAAPRPITSKIRTAHNQFRDDGYIGGYSPVDQRLVTVTSSYFITAYLGALAKQDTKIGTGGNQKKEDSRWMFSDYSSVSLQSLAVDGESSFEAPVSKVSELFQASSEEAYEIVNSLREHVKENNPYKDIPIRVNQAELLDALLRMEILNYCEANDSNFSIQEVIKV